MSVTSSTVYAFTKCCTKLVDTTKAPTKPVFYSFFDKQKMDRQRDRAKGPPLAAIYITLCNDFCCSGEKLDLDTHTVSLNLGLNTTISVLARR